MRKSWLRLRELACLIVCALIVSAALDRQPDPPATKPTPSQSGVFSAFSHPDVPASLPIGLAFPPLLAQVPASHFTPFEYKLGARVPRRLILVRQAGDVSPPSGAAILL